MSHESSAYWNSIYDFGHYGICSDHLCLYQENNVQLIQDLTSGQDFDTGWHGFKKELQSMRIRAHGQHIRIYISVWCDDLEDLISTDSQRGCELSEAQYEEVCRLCEDLPTQLMLDRSIPRNSKLLDVLSAAAELADLADKELDDTFQKVTQTIDTVLAQDKD